MSKAEKLVARFLTIPVDFTWEELVTLLAHYGFEEMKEKGGSYRCFVSSLGKIFLHRPHPANIVKRYALKQVRDKLVEYDLLSRDEAGLK